LRKLTILLAAMALISTAGVSAEDKPTFKIKGDFRYRHEMIDKQDTKTETRHRVRARVNIEGRVNDQAQVVFGISSGSSDPVSNNQTLTGGFSSKDVVLDVAFIEYKWMKAPGLTLLGGKVYNPFFAPGESELIWDSDIRPEGMAAHYTRGTDQMSINLTGAGFWVEERKSNKNSSLFGGQAVFQYEIPDSKAEFALGGSYFDYVNSKGFEPYFGEAKGNTVTFVEPDSIYVYANEYRLAEILGEFTFEAGEMPIMLSGDYVTNTAADSLNDGWLVSVKIGKTKKPGSWDIRYVYRELKKDAVVGIYTDSDFIGGGTNGKGHEFNVGLQVAEKTSLAATYFINKIGFTNEKDFNRLQIDAKFKF
jgi:hypothetical protein